MSPLSFGLFSMNTGPCSHPGAMVRIARAAEAAGFDSLWSPEHYVLPSSPSPTLQVDPMERMLDPLETLSYLAGATERISLASGVIVLPHHNPLVLAKRIATLQVLSSNRFIFGVGVGHLQPEFEALGTPMAGRGRLADEMLDAMHSLWFDDEPQMDGEYIRFSGVQAYPRPEGVPIVVGGRSPVAYRRAVERGHGFYGWMLDPAATEAALDHLEQAVQVNERPGHLGRLQISVTPPVPVDLALAERYAGLGVDRLIVAPGREADEAEALDLIERVGTAIIPRFG